MFNANIQHNGQNKSLTLYIVEGDVPNLLGHEWFEELGFDWRTIYTSTTVSKQALLQPLLDQYLDILKMH